MSLPLRRFLNAVWWWALQRVEDRARFEFELSKPPAGMVSVEDADAEREMFSSLMAMMGR